MLRKCLGSWATTVPVVDCYRLLRFEIFTKYNEYCPRERCCTGVSSPLAAYYVIVVMSVTIGVFRNNPD